MPLPSPVLVVASSGDLSADLVVQQLEQRDVDVMRIDPNDLGRSSSLRLTGHSDADQLRFTLTDGYRETHSPAITAVWWWHPDTPASWAESESRTIFDSLMYGLKDVLWVNHPLKNLSGRPGPAQLKRASDLGLRTPPALYTNDPDAAAQFAASLSGKVVCKTLTAHPDRFVPARIVTTEEIREDANNVREAVHCFQAHVDKVADIRLTVVGDRLFPCKIRASREQLDWRAVPERDLTFEATAIPLPLAQKVHKLMRGLGLEYAALDFAVDHSGTWWFLECNPSGQFGFIEAATGMVISRAITDHLVQTSIKTRVFTPDGGHRASSVPRRAGPSRL